jgi:membrane-associated phospholipid phosphatase
MFRLTKHRTLTHVILATTALILAANYYIRDALYALGLDLIRQMQADHSDMGRLFFQLVTMASEPGVVAVVVLGILVGEAKRKHAFNVTMFMLLNIYLITLLKVLYVDPRPFWSVEHIHNLALYCPAEFGNPSGHSWFITVLLFLLLLKYFPWLPRVSALLGVTVVVALVATSRMYLGAHSLNQVVLGVTLGMVLNCLYYICGLDDRITEFLEDFNREPRLGWKKYMLLCQGLTFLAYFYAETDIARNADTYSRLAANARD